MSKKIPVIGENRDVKRSIAELLVRRLTHEPILGMVGDKVKLIGIKAKPLREFAPADVRLERPVAAKPYIPEKMPPREVPGCYFQPPQSIQWKLAHRTVILPSSSVTSFTASLPQ